MFMMNIFEGNHSRELQFAVRSLYTQWSAVINGKSCRKEMESCVALNNSIKSSLKRNEVMSCLSVVECGKTVWRFDGYCLEMIAFNGCGFRCMW